MFRYSYVRMPTEAVASGITELGLCKTSTIQSLDLVRLLDMSNMVAVPSLVSCIFIIGESYSTISLDSGFFVIGPWNVKGEPSQHKTGILGERKTRGRPMYWYLYRCGRSTKGGS
jgi:hypothetical protein